MTKIGARQVQILQLLLKNRVGLSLDQIASSLDISRTAVLQHFSKLQKLDYICEGSLDKTGGRPLRNYCLTERGINSFPKQYSWFSELLLKSLKQQMGAEALRHYMYRLGEQVAESLLPNGHKKNLSDRIEHLLSVMDELGYEAILETSEVDQVSKIKARNCVYHDIAQQHPEICQFDLALMNHLLDSEVELEQCLAKGDSVCCFKLKK